MIARPTAGEGAGAGAGAGPGADTETLGVRELNGALLARQHLLVRAETTVVSMTNHLVGLQAQNPTSPYLALWSRLDGFGHDELSTALLDRQVARIVVMRGTIHLVTADDALLLSALVAPMLRHQLRTHPTFAAALRDVDLDELATAARDLVESEPMAGATLGAALADRWPDVDPKALAYAARGTLPLVQVTPRGMWRRSMQPTWTTTRAWLGREQADLSSPEARQDALERVVLRYLAAFGPASTADLTYWCGLTGLSGVISALRPRLVAFRAEPRDGRPGRELFDLPGAPRPPVPTADGHIAPPVRFLSDYDNLTIAHADRTRVVTDEHRRALVSPNGVGPGKVLIDGMVAGTWRIDQPPGSTVATLDVAPFGPPLDPRRRRAVAEEAERVVRFVADEAAQHRVTL